MAYSIQIKEAAKRLFLRGAKPAEIQRALKLPNARVVYYWAERGQWNDILASDEPLNALNRRLTLLLEKNETLSRAELNEIERLVKQRGELLRQINPPAAGAGHSERGEPEPAAAEPGKSTPGRSRKKRERPPKNDISGLTAERFEQWFADNLFRYQAELLAAKNDPALNRTRNILKSRQIGLTWYFAREAFADAVLTGDNQIFLSASRAQAEIFRSEIISFADELGVKLSGNPIRLSNGANLYFLSTNASTAQSYHGHLHVDEYFWIPKFTRLQTVAAGMASHKKWRKTYFSTPSAITHEAYTFWSGEQFRNGRHRNAKKPWPTPAELHQGALCPDGQYRKIIDIDDAVRGGCDLFDIEQLRLEFSDEAFRQLYKCQFIDDTQTVFSLNELEKCLADAHAWRDFRPGLARPFGDAPVWVGYDPSRKRDDASCVVLSAPTEPGGRFRVLEKHQWRNQSYTWQAEQVRKITERYNVEFIGIDTTGCGYAVFDLVRDFWPRARQIHYSLDSKNALVLKGQDVIRSGRIHWDAGQTDIASAFLTIRRTTTSGGQITYSASRTAETGHADVAWAILHALSNEPLNINRTRRSRYALIEQRKTA